MKNNVKRNIVIVAIAMFGLSNSVEAVEKSKTASAGERSVHMIVEVAFLQDYFSIKDALVNDNYEEAKKAAIKLKKSLEDAPIEGEKVDVLNTIANDLAVAGDLKEQRQVFGKLSQQLYELIGNSNLVEDTLYWQQCPMAMGGAGANWLSLEEQVKNPYMGQRMPGCGMVQEKL